jgi:ABC-2 type transport system permease protein
MDGKDPGVSELMLAARTGRVLFSRAVQGRLAYAKYFFLSLMGFFVSFGLTLMLWLYVNGQRAGGLAVGRDDLIAYLALALAVNFVLSLSLDSILSSRIRSGQVAVDLLKPLSFQWMYFFMSMADVAIQACMAAVVLVIAFLTLSVKPLKLEAAQLAVFFCSMVLAILVQYGICFIFTLGAFFTNFGYGMFNLRLMTQATFSGAFAPLVLYPPSLRVVAYALPFHCVVQTPAILGLGWVSAGQALPLLAEQLAWAVGLFLVGQTGFRWILGRLSIQGG